MPVEEQDTSGDTSLEGMSSPMDSAVDMKKRKRLRMLAAKAEEEEKKKVDEGVAET